MAVNVLCKIEYNRQMEKSAIIVLLINAGFNARRLHY